jgi:hypothetical protein
VVAPSKDINSLPYPSGGKVRAQTANDCHMSRTLHNTSTSTLLYSLLTFIKDIIRSARARKASLK